MSTKVRTKYKNRSGVGTGTTSLLMIFTVLCFATLAMLSLTTAMSNRSMQQTSFKLLENRLAAEGAVAERLAELDDALVLLAQDEDYLVQASMAAQELGWQKLEGKNELLLQTPIDAENEIQTTIRLLDFNAGVRYEILAQKSAWTGEWVPEQEAGLWPGFDN